MIENKAFNEYVELYKKLPLQKKKEIVESECKKTLAFIEKLNSDLNLDNNILFNKEIMDLKTTDISDDDFTEAMFVYINMIKESLGKYVLEISKIMYK